MKAKQRGKMDISCWRHPLHLIHHVLVLSSTCIKEDHPWDKGTEHTREKPEIEVKRNQALQLTSYPSKSRRTRFCRCSTLLLFNNCAKIRFHFVAAAIQLYSILHCKVLMCVNLLVGK
ncbi:hypothetical protein Dimus_037927 [Dionaea muscipula]